MYTSIYIPLSLSQLLPCFMIIPFHHLHHLFYDAGWQGPAITLLGFHLLRLEQHSLQHRSGPTADALRGALHGGRPRGGEEENLFVTPRLRQDPGEPEDPQRTRNLMMAMVENQTWRQRFCKGNLEFRCHRGPPNCSICLNNI